MILGGFVAAVHVGIGGKESSISAVGARLPWRTDQEQNPSTLLHVCHMALRCELLAQTAPAKSCSLLHNLRCNQE